MKNRKFHSASSVMLPHTPTRCLTGIKNSILVKIEIFERNVNKQEITEDINNQFKISITGEDEGTRLLRK